MHRTLTLNEQQIDDFTWLQDNDPGDGDLLVIRVGREGRIDKPFVLLDCTINQNTARYSDMVLSHAGIDIGLIKDGVGVIYLIQEHCGLFTSDHQLCAILPLEPKVYESQRQKSNESSIFEPLGDLLDFESLYRIYDLECNSHEDCRKPRMKEPSDEAGDEEYNTKSHEGGCDKSTSKTTKQTRVMGTMVVPMRLVEKRKKRKGKKKRKMEELTMVRTIMMSLLPMNTSITYKQSGASILSVFKRRGNYRIEKWAKETQNIFLGNAPGVIAARYGWQRWIAILLQIPTPVHKPRGLSRLSSH